MPHNTLYTLLFAAAICVVCGILVSTSAVTLHDRQETNAELEKKRNVLVAAGFVAPQDRLTQAEVDRHFARIEPRVIHLETGQEAPEIDALAFDQKEAAADPASSREAPDNLARVRRLPEHALTYSVLDEAGALDMVILPVEGYGLWSTLYGFLALDADTTTIRGLTFYDHKETPGLGGEVDNPNWKALWPGRKAFNEAWDAKIEVIKGQSGPSNEDPYRVDGLSGASITSLGVTRLLHFWLGENGFEPYLERLRQNRPAVSGQTPSAQGEA